MTDLHKVRLPDETLDYVRKRHGGALHAWDRIAPARTALVVIDMQNVWCKEGFRAYSPYCAALGPNINRLAAALRAAGGKVFWVRAIYADAPRTWPSYVGYHSADDVAAMVRNLTDGDPGAEIWDGMDVAPGDDIVIKTRFSAFIRGSSDLEDRLRAAGIEMLILTGVATDICVESTARDGMMLGFRNIVVSDATATRSDAAHNASLAAMLTHFADVYATDETLALIDAARKGAAAE